MSESAQHVSTAPPPQAVTNCGGKRVGARSLIEHPLISIITVAFNKVKDLERTIQSVVTQRYTTAEFIVVDGGSTDGSPEILKAYDDSLDYWVSEPDSGIYDAINKACKLIRGDWMLFLGAGDTLHDDSVLERIAEVLKDVDQSTEIVYGRVCLQSESGVPSKVWNKPWTEMNGLWETGRPILPQHQGVFHRKRIVSGIAPFDTSYRIAADSKLLLSSIKRVEPLFADVVVTDIQLGGVSTDPKHSLRLAREVRRLTNELGYRNTRHQAWTYLKALIKVTLYQFGGSSASRRFIDAYRRLTGRPGIWNAL